MANDLRAFTIFYLTIILVPFAIPVVHGATRLVSSLMLGTVAALRSAVRHTRRPHPRRESLASSATAD
jgi:hypothetical protein